MPIISWNYEWPHKQSMVFSWILDEEPYYQGPIKEIWAWFHENNIQYRVWTELDNFGGFNDGHIELSDHDYTEFCLRWK